MIPRTSQTPTIGAHHFSAVSYGGSSMSRIGIVTPPMTARAAGIIAIAPMIGTIRCLIDVELVTPLAEEVADAGEVHEEVDPREDQAEHRPQEDVDVQPAEAAGALGRLEWVVGEHEAEPDGDDQGRHGLEVDRVHRSVRLR